MEPSSSNTYVYTPLQPGQIRLVTLLPSKAMTDPIRCTLSTVGLPDCPEPDAFSNPYEALSYMWGTSTSSSWGVDIFIKVGEGQLRVRPNLFRALRRLRDRKTPRVLWIDSICINQASKPERNDQVRRMQDIYRNASTVLVWLGDVQVRSSRSLLNEQKSSRGLPPLSNAGKFLTKLESVVDLCCAPYWRRLWIIQEMLSARKLVIYCGPVSCPWAELVKALEHTEANKEYESTVPSLLNTPMWTLVRTLRGRESLRLKDLLLRHGDSECLDPRDKVYG